VVKKGEKGVPRSAETRVKIGIGARNTRLSETKPCPYACGGIFNSGNMVTHIRRHHTAFVCKIQGCTHNGDGKRGLGYCGPHYRLHAFCVRVGTTIEEYYKVYEEQGGKCKLCPREGTLQLSGTGDKVDVLVIDHCHTSGKFRGLLCHNCNIALGHFKDDISVLENAIAYLKGEK
jgi:hypothetical protein